MNSSNTSNSGFQYIDCEVIKEMTVNYSNVFQTQSVALDLVPSILGSIFLFRYYQGIEISHPLYAVIFMDVIISTTSSFVSFILNWITLIYNSCVMGHVKYWINSTCFFNSICSFMMIAFIRYYFLVYSKKNNEQCEINLAKARKIAIFANIGIFCSILIIRGSLHTMMLLGYAKVFVLLIVFTITTISFVVFPLLIAAIVNYKIDMELQRFQNDKNLNKLKKKVVRKSDQSGKKVNDKLKSHCKRADKLQYSVLGTTRNQKIDIFAITENGPRTKSETYGGIYIGDENICSSKSRCANEKKATKSVPETCTLPHQVERDFANEDIEAIDLVDDHAESLPSTNDIFPPDNALSIQDEFEDYKDSREHKAMIKSLKILFAYLIFILIPLVLFHVLYLNRRANIALTIVFSSLIILFRSFAVILATTYCFELIRSLFVTFVTEIVEYCHGVCNRIRQHF